MIKVIKRGEIRSKAKETAIQAKPIKVSNSTWLNESLRNIRTQKQNETKRFFNVG